MRRRFFDVVDPSKLERYSDRRREGLGRRKPAAVVRALDLFRRPLQCLPYRELQMLFHKQVLRVDQEYALADAELKEIVVTDCLETLCNPDAGPKAKEKARADLIRIWATTARRITLVNPDGSSLQNLSDDELQAIEQQLGLESAPPGPGQSPAPPTAVPDHQG